MQKFITKNGKKIPMGKKRYNLSLSDTKTKPHLSSVERSLKNKKGMEGIMNQRKFFTLSKERGVGYTDDEKGNYHLIKKGGWDDLQGNGDHSYTTKNRKVILNKLNISQPPITSWEQKWSLQPLSHLPPDVRKKIKKGGFDNVRIPE